MEPRIPPRGRRENHPLQDIVLQSQTPRWLRRAGKLQLAAHVAFGEMQTFPQFWPSILAAPSSPPPHGTAETIGACCSSTDMSASAKQSKLEDAYVRTAARAIGARVSAALYDTEVRRRIDPRIVEPRVRPTQPLARPVSSRPTGAALPSGRLPPPRNVERSHRGDAAATPWQHRGSDAAGARG